jgi:aryl-alcohol dehydrogenase-like predicted oxidoreductase
MQLHNTTVDLVEDGDLVAALQEMKEQGKVRWIGISSTIPHIDTFIERDVFDVFQIPFSALEREHEKQVQKAADAGAGVIVRGGVARGEPGVGLGGEDRWKAWRDGNHEERIAPGETPRRSCCGGP